MHDLFFSNVLSYISVFLLTAFFCPKNCDHVNGAHVLQYHTVASGLLASLLANLDNGFNCRLFAYI